ncbi:rRNA maturation RNase YbeY [Dethiothermospora halolimnae]|uniref:rRNA maturation RNase YbeY n=1 Tax=Dethiothermospora halolimnae TaxID=3114390 RepID=UPI003CCB9956
MDVIIDNRQDKIIIDQDIIDTINLVIKECLKFEDKGFNYEISVSIVNDEEIKELNNQYRDKNSATDVLSFPMEDDNSLDGIIPLLGDIVISAEKALEQSEEYNHSFKREIAYLTAHSMFHLMGYDHIEKEDKKVMREKEKEIMKLLKIFKS